MKVQRTTVITLGLLAFLAGLGAARVLPALGLAWVLLALAVLIAFRRRPVVLVIAAVACGFVAGWWRGGMFLQLLKPYQQLARRPVVIQITAQGDAVYGDKGQLTFDGGSAKLLEPFAEDLPGRIKVAGYGAPAVYRGDVVEVRGSFFPTRGSRQGTVSFAQLRVLGRSGSPIETVRREFVAGMETALPEPHASFSLGLLIGQRTTLPKELSDNLSAVGLTHIIAVSGYNLTILVRAVRGLGKKRSKYQLTLFSLLLMGGFVLVTGFSASIVRAALVSVLSLAAWYYGRTFRPVLLLALVAALTAGWSPLYLWSDIGWHLSFLAFYGVLVVVPLLVRRFYGPKKQPRPAMQLVYETLAAQAMTAPLILYIFEEISLIAFVGNVLVVPLVPVAMLLAFVAGLAGMALPVLAGWIALPATAVLTYMLDVVELLARVPHAVVNHTLPLAVMLILYATIAWLSVVTWRKSQTKHGIITDTETSI